MLNNLFARALNIPNNPKDISVNRVDRIVDCIIGAAAGIAALSLFKAKVDFGKD